MTRWGVAQLWSALVLLALLPAVRVQAADANSPASVTPPKSAAAATPPSVAPVSVSELESQTLRRGPALSEKPKATTQKTGTTSTSTRDSNGYDAVRVTTALLAVIALILFLRWIAKRVFGVSGPSRSSRAVQVLSRSPLTPRQSVMLLRVGRRVIVVADGGGQMSTLGEITDADEVAELIGQIHTDHTDRAGAGFGNLFAKMRGTYEAQDNTIAGRLNEAAGDDDGEPAEDEEECQTVAATRTELTGLMDKVRMLSRQFKNP
jgi:flagellar biogenesis protein FliO